MFKLPKMRTVTLTVPRPKGHSWVASDPSASMPNEDMRVEAAKKWLTDQMDTNKVKAATDG